MFLSCHICILEGIYITLCSSVNVKELLARTDVISDVEVAAMGFEPTTS